MMKKSKVVKASFFEILDDFRTESTFYGKLESAAGEFILGREMDGDVRGRVVTNFESLPQSNAQTTATKVYKIDHLKNLR